MTLVVGFSPDKDERAALEYAGMLARSAGQDLLVVSVVPAPWPTPLSGGVDKEYAAYARERGARAVAAAESLLAELCPDVTGRAVAVPGRSVPGALADEAEKAGAAMVVVGSGSDGAYGHVVVSSTADRLLHSSPVPVAVSTRGFRTPAQSRVARVTCAYRGDEISNAVLTRAAEICADIGAALRVATFGVRGRTMYPPEVLGEQQVLDAFVEHTSAAQEKAVQSLPGGVATESVVAVGRTWSEALDRLAWDKGDVLVVGSSTASLMARVFLGSNATKIVRHSPVPVVVVP